MENGKLELAKNEYPTELTNHFALDTLNYLKSVYAPSLTSKDFSLLVMTAKNYNLDISKKEIYGVPMGGKFTVIVSIGGLRKIAARSGVHAGTKIEYVYENGEVNVIAEFPPTAKSKLIGCKCTVWKIVLGQKAEYSAVVSLKEYAKSSANWVSMPATMLKKVAESHVLRMAFDEIGGLYEGTEMGIEK